MEEKLVVQGWDKGKETIVHRCSLCWRAMAGYVASGALGTRIIPPWDNGFVRITQPVDHSQTCKDRGTF